MKSMNVDIVDGHIAALMKKLNITDVFPLTGSISLGLAT